jgi:hypothetical protein
VSCCLAAGWDTPLSTLSPVLGCVSTPLSLVSEILLHAVYVLNWHLLEDPKVYTHQITMSLLAVNTVAKTASGTSQGHQEFVGWPWKHSAVQLCQLVLQELLLRRVGGHRAHVNGSPSYPYVACRHLQESGKIAA